MRERCINDMTPSSAMYLEHFYSFGNLKANRNHCLFKITCSKPLCFRSKGQRLEVSLWREGSLPWAPYWKRVRHSCGLEETIWFGRSGIYNISIFIDQGSFFWRWRRSGDLWLGCYQSFEKYYIVIYIYKIYKYLQYYLCGLVDKPHLFRWNLGEPTTTQSFFVDFQHVAG